MTSNHRHSRVHLRRLGFEVLEDRRVLAASLDLAQVIGIAPVLESGAPHYVNASQDSSNHQSEITLDVNPSNPLNLAGFSYRLTHSTETHIEIDVFYSIDGGTTWGTQTINNLDENDGGLYLGNADRRFDPSIAFDADGNLFIAYGHVAASSGIRTLVVAKSTDGGANFSQFRSVDSADFLDKWHLATGPDGPGSNNQAVYVAYTKELPGFPTQDQVIMVAGSNDGGATFKPEHRVQVSDDAGVTRKHFFADPAVGPSGELYVSWHDITDLAHGRIYFDSDLDGLFNSSNGFGTDVLVKQTELLLFQYGVDAAPLRGIHTGPVVDVDRSGGDYHGRLYLTWVDAIDVPNFDTDNNSDIFLAWSDDHGANGTWTIPDLPGDVGNVEDSTGTDFLPWVDVDQVTGSVNLLYYTTDGDQATGNDDVHVRLATSIDGGQSFTYATMSRHTSNENDPPGSTQDYLEYIGLAVHGGTAHALWASRVPGGGLGGTDLEALYASASLLSIQGDNVLYITGDDSGAATSDTIELKRSMANAAYLEVWVNGNRQYTGLMATINVIDITALGGGDDIFIDADIDANFIVRGGDGGDDLTLRGKGASQLGSVEFQGEADNDTLTVNFVNGDPLPRPGFNFDFNLIGDPGEENVSAIDGAGTHVGFFVNTFIDAADNNLNDGRADSSGATDDQTTLRAAVQQSNFASDKNYIFLPSDTNLLSVAGTGGDLQGDLDITSNVTIIGSGAGVSIVDASGLVATTDRVFDVASGATLNLSRITLTGGKARNATNENGGAIRVAGTLNLLESALVDNRTTHSGGDGGAIFFLPSAGGTITNSVITDNHANDATGGIFLASDPPNGTVTLTGTIVANNTAGQTTGVDVRANGSRAFTNGGNNRLGNETAGLVHNDNGNHVGLVNYIVTGLGDTFDGTADKVVMSIRDAIYQANVTAGAQEIWLPAWDFLLTRDRQTFGGGIATDMSVAFGDLDIGKDTTLGDPTVGGSLTIRGVNGSTSVTWRAGLPNDKVFELLGDYNNDGIADSEPADVDSADYVVWRRWNGTSNTSADGDDDGDTDQDDFAVWTNNFGNTLMLLGIS
jgi:hypothetical protein